MFLDQMTTYPKKLPETKRIADLIRMCMYHIQEQG